LSIALAQESVAQIKSDVLSLAPAHYKEAGTHYLNPDEFDLDLGVYEGCEIQGITRIFTARDEGKLVGYCGMFVSPRTTQSGSRLKWAHQDALYVVPEYRGPMVMRFLAYQDISLEREGCNKIYRHVPVDGRFDRLLSHLGYNYIDRGYVRTLRGAA
jgi:GNAT superfamily N-acetyltransferase